jgi:pimeloyl-ACP methyl ester carboxylesterase
MPTARVRGIAIQYEIFGDGGATTNPWVALSTGGRNPYGEFVPLAERIAAGGFRVVLHDRRNCGASQVALDDSQGEDAHRVDDLHALMQQLDALPAFFGGSSSGCRMSLLYCLKHPELVRGLLLMRVTGGPYPASQLPDNYYGQFIRAARHGGMAAVCAMEHWRGVIEARPANREILMAMTPQHFIAVMTRWRELFCEGIDGPAVGITREQLGSIRVPTIVVPGNDRIHSLASGKLAASLIANARLHLLPIEDTGAELVWFPEWAPHYDEMARVFIDFMRAAMVRRPEAD